MSFKNFYRPLHMGASANPNGYHVNRNKKHNYKIVYRFDLEGKYLNKYKFNKSICEEMSLNYNGIRLASRPTWSDKQRILSSMDSIWILQEDYTEEELQRKVQEKKMDSNINSSANKRSKRIVQKCAETKEIIKIWDSINQAGREEKTGYKVSYICRVLNGSRHTYAGCTWEYAIEGEENEKKLNISA